MATEAEHQAAIAASTLKELRDEMDGYIAAVDRTIGPLPYWKDVLAAERAVADSQIEYWGRKYADLAEEAHR